MLWRNLTKMVMVHSEWKIFGSTLLSALVLGSTLLSRAPGAGSTLLSALVFGSTLLSALVLGSTLLSRAPGAGSKSASSVLTHVCVDFVSSFLLPPAYREDRLSVPWTSMRSWPNRRRATDGLRLSHDLHLDRRSRALGS